MRLFKQTYKDRRGLLRTSAKWYVEFRDQDLRVRRLPLLTNKSASEEIGRKIERLVACKVAGEAPAADLCRWLSSCQKDLVKGMVRLGLVEPSRIALTKTLAEHLNDYLAELSTKGNSVKHAAVTHARAKRVIEGCNWKSVVQVKAEEARAFLVDLWKEEKIGARSYAYYVRDLKAFGKWLVRTRRSIENPLEHLLPLGSKAIANDDRRIRRALQKTEVSRLLRATATAPDRFGMTGAERALVYRLAVETGLRASELGTLTVASFRLEAAPPTVYLPGSGTKNARAAELPLRPTTVVLLKEHLASRMPNSKAFNMPPSTQTARMIREDLAAAGIVARDAADRVVDFHALRHTFLTLLANSGVHPKVAQDLARHSDVNLTLSRYSHTVLEQRSEAVERLPDFDEGEESQAKTS